MKSYSGNSSESSITAMYRDDPAVLVPGPLLLDTSALEDCVVDTSVFVFATTAVFCVGAFISFMVVDRVGFLVIVEEGSGLAEPFNADLLRLLVVAVVIVEIGVLLSGLSLVSNAVVALVGGIVECSKGLLVRVAVVVLREPVLVEAVREPAAVRVVLILDCSVGFSNDEPVTNVLLLVK